MIGAGRGGLAAGLERGSWGRNQAFSGKGRKRPGLRCLRTKEVGPGEADLPGKIMLDKANKV